MDIERVKQTVRDLLRLAANDAAAAGEVANAVRFASKLMADHQLAEADLGQVAEKVLDIERAECSRVNAACGSTINSSWEGQAALWVCAFVGGVKCHCGPSVQLKTAAGLPKFDERGNAVRRASMAFYGLAEDVAVAVAVFEDTVTTIAALAKLRYGSIYRGDGRCYCDGFCAGLFSVIRADKVKQLEEAEQARRLAVAAGNGQAAGAGKALALIQGRGAIVVQKEKRAESWLRSQGVRLRTRSSGGATHHNSGAYSQGRSDGARHGGSAQRPGGHKRLS